jgi:hypothetical protein
MGANTWADAHPVFDLNRQDAVGYNGAVYRWALRQIRALRHRTDTDPKERVLYEVGVGSLRIRDIRWASEWDQEGVPILGACLHSST